MKQDDELLEIIPLVLGCNSANGKEEGVLIETDVAKEILESLKDNSFSHLMEVTELLFTNFVVHYKSNLLLTCYLI